MGEAKRAFHDCGSLFHFCGSFVSVAGWVQIFDVSVAGWVCLVYPGRITSSQLFAMPLLLPIVMLLTHFPSTGGFHIMLMVGNWRYRGGVFESSSLTSLKDKSIISSENVHYTSWVRSFYMLLLAASAAGSHQPLLQIFVCTKFVRSCCMLLLAATSHHHKYFSCPSLPFRSN